MGIGTRSSKRIIERMAFLLVMGLNLNGSRFIMRADHSDLSKSSYHILN
jgi:hypothetical protein